MYPRMNVHEVAASIIASSHIRTAFEISAALGEVRQQLLRKFISQLLSQLPFLTGDAPGDCGGFLRAAEGQPFLIRRVAPAHESGPVLWGGLAIGLAFEQQRLFYGICQDTMAWPAAKLPESGPHNQGVRLREVLPRGGGPRERWLWWQWVGPATEQELYPAMADQAAGCGSCTLAGQLKPAIERLAAALDLLCQPASAGRGAAE